MANPASPIEAGGTKLGYGMASTGAASVAAFQRIIRQGTMHAEDTPSGWVAVATALLGDEVDADAPAMLAALLAAASDPAAAADGDAVAALADVIGRTVVAPYALPASLVDGASGGITDTADAGVIAAPGSGARLHITEITITNGHATTGTYVAIKSDTTERRRVYVPAGATVTIAIPGGLRLGDNEALNAANVTDSSETHVSASGYVGR
jgi:hypothetical protein